MKLDAQQLRQMVAEDQYGLLDVPEKPVPMSPEDRLLARFNDIVDFVTAHGREPEISAKDIAEKKLAMRLKAIAGNEEQYAVLKEFDALGLLQEPEPPKSIADVLEDDDFGLLDSDGPGIHTLTHVPRQVVAASEEVATREPCKDFGLFEPLFKKRHADLRAGRSKLTRFRSRREIVPEKFYVVNGVLVYVADVDTFFKDSHGRDDARLRLIYENGTESNMLRKSLATRLYENGKVVTEPTDQTLCAAQIIGEVAGVARFTNEAQLASYAGVSPIPASSGKNQRHRLNRYGNRRLNRAIHIIAVTQMRMHPPAREYIARRLEEGKTSREAQRTLKRYITRAVFNTLKTADLTT